MNKARPKGVSRSNKFRSRLVSRPKASRAPAKKVVTNRFCRGRPSRCRSSAPRPSGSSVRLGASGHGHGPSARVVAKLVVGDRKAASLTSLLAIQSGRRHLFSGGDAAKRPNGERCCLKAQIIAKRCGYAARGMQFALWLMRPGVWQQNNGCRLPSQQC